MLHEFLSLKDNPVLNFPIPETSISTTSPCCRYYAGFWKIPTPTGVPVITAVPAGMVVPVVPMCQQHQSRRVQIGQLTLAHKAKYPRTGPDPVLLTLDVLSNLSIDSGHEANVLLLVEKLCLQEQRAHRGKLVESLCKEELPAAHVWHLMLAAGQVIANGISRNVGGCFVEADIFRCVLGDEDYR